MRIVVIVLGGNCHTEKILNEQLQNHISFCYKRDYNLLQPKLSINGATPPLPYIRVIKKNNFYLSYLLYLRCLNHIPIQHPPPPKKNRL
jgi:hypothetical protein